MSPGANAWNGSSPVRTTQLVVQIRHRANATWLTFRRRFCPTGKSEKSCPVLFAKIFLFSTDPNHLYNLRRPIPQRGYSRSSRMRGGMRWTRQRRARKSSQGVSLTRERSNGVQTNDACAYGQVVWFWHPLLVSSRRRFFEPDRVSISR